MKAKTRKAKHLDIPLKLRKQLQSIENLQQHFTLYDAVSILIFCDLEVLL